jgi:hypothetical protein
MSSVVLSKTIEPPWTAMTPTLLGDVPTTLSTPDLYALISSESGPTLRLDLYRGNREYSCFQEAAIWNEFAVVGFAQRVHLVSLRSKQHVEFKLDSYFGSLWPGEAYLLVASAEHVLCIRIDGTLRWRSPPLGVDGVLVHEVANGVVKGDGEWDPPGGWEPFRLSLEDGTLLPAA